MRVAVTLPTVFEGQSLAQAVGSAADAGADGVEFFDWENADLDAVAAACDEHDVSVAGTLAAGAGSSIEETAPAMTDPEYADEAVVDIERSIETAADLGAPTLIVTVGAEQDHLSRAEQRASIERVLSAVAPAAEAADVTLVVELLNVAVDHPGYFLTTTADGVDLVESVDSSSVKLLYDVYHQQITEGNIIETMTDNLDAIGHVHIADVPGRHEPGTGELNYRNVLAALAEAGYDGYVGCEFFPVGDPADAVADVVDVVETTRQ
ncbi:hydroxypyruvate isomerase family protein [Halogeometricum limi]|uniref:Hydroxypyruvate isomerase n=1 Tax=Halogeometricum limi TaxID=555875 RepID=A0A1I6IDG0_9EURY|nr:TIM barrel protein [Halogeometricum limi]SFR64741.1 hydroxypyruvate isomerase [Halogeometricum limi]